MLRSLRRHSSFWLERGSHNPKVVGSNPTVATHLNFICMSDKGLLFKKRKNNHGSHHKCSKGSGFPRHSMNHYLRTNRITGFINKFIGKPYNDLVKAFYVLIKDLRDSHKEVGLSDLEWHFEQFRYRRVKEVLL